ncbi:hypothetical protein C2G38_2151567 [Gigaspora rosea]|uniref:Uncharacterized protein n=1 Tax=Gigaspora rosea TaxID=44941 RepID=A0A397W7Z0_9GLOM|nr:hypothetical protein C2G38_2251679 [Gigaspora rosea]RIB30815.1 hypothetical protein C2G38_2151567 [Gigaspora rosea]
MDDRYFQTIDDPDLYVNDDPDFHIVDGGETIYEDLESFENKSVLISSNDELQEIDDTIASDLNEDIITYFTKELATRLFIILFFSQSTQYNYHYFVINIDYFPFNLFLPLHHDPSLNQSN